MRSDLEGHAGPGLDEATEGSILRVDQEIEPPGYEAPRGTSKQKQWMENGEVSTGWCARKGLLRRQSSGALILAGRPALLALLLKRAKRLIGRPAYER